MPGMTGLELATLIRQRKRTQDVPILFLTAHMVDERDALMGYKAGAVDYLTKPISPDIMRSKVRVFVDLYRKTQQLAHLNATLEQRVEERTAALKEADRRKDEFLAALAHELRNPLAALRSAAEVFRLKAAQLPELAQPQGVIHRQIRQMTRLIDDLLDVSRITRDQLTLQRERTTLHRVVSAARETVQPVIQRRGHKLVVDIPQDSIELDADVIRLAQVFANLLDNAAKYTEHGGVIRLTGAVEGQEVVVKVDDTGVGIDPGQLSGVFELFRQAHGSPDPGYGGLGIGLTLVRRLVEMHNGTVTANSDGLGKGCTFTVRLPLAEKA
jgi:signal transduction histidine kinase